MGQANQGYFFLWGRLAALGSPRRQAEQGVPLGNVPGAPYVFRLSCRGREPQFFQATHMNKIFRAVILILLFYVSCITQYVFAENKWQASLESALLKQGLTTDKYSEITSSYYKSHQADDLTLALKAVLSVDDLILDKEQFGAIAHFFVSAAHTDKVFFDKIDSLKPSYSGLQKQVLETMLQEAVNFSSPDPDSPDHLDYLWAEFLSSGDSQPVRKIMSLLNQAAPDLKEPNISEGVLKERVLFYVAARSLISNAFYHQKVFQILEDEIALQSGVYRDNLTAILDKVKAYKSSNADNSVNQDQSIDSLLTTFGYPEKSHELIKHEMESFLNDIGLPDLKNEFQKNGATENSIATVAVQAWQSMKKFGYMDTQNPTALQKLLVDSFGSENILSIIESSTMSYEEKTAEKNNVFACSATTQLALIALKMIGIDARSAISPNHVFVAIPVGDNRIIVADFKNDLFEVFDLPEWYEVKGSYWVLKEKHRIPYSQLATLMQNWIQNGEPPKTLAETLNVLYSYIYVTKRQDATAFLYGRRGAVFFATGYLDDALKNFNEALMLDDNIADHFTNRGAVYATKRDFDKALNDFNKSLTLNPDDSFSLHNRSQLYTELGNAEQARLDAKRAEDLGYSFFNAETK